VGLYVSSVRMQSFTLVLALARRVVPIEEQ